MNRYTKIKSFWVFLLAAILILFTFNLLWGEKPKKNEKNLDLVWYKYDQGLKKAEKDKKHLMVYFYTKYCGYCRKMEKNTFSDQEVKKVLGDDYINVRVDGGSKNKVNFNGSQITERELALKYRVMGYPVNWFLKPDGEKIAPLVGYRPAEDFLDVLGYVKDGAYEKMSFSEYIKKKKEKGKEID